MLAINHCLCMRNIDKALKCKRATFGWRKKKKKSFCARPSIDSLEFHVARSYTVMRRNLWVYKTLNKCVCFLHTWDQHELFRKAELKQIIVSLIPTNNVKVSVDVAFCWNAFWNKLPLWQRSEYIFVGKWYWLDDVTSSQCSVIKSEKHCT